MSCKSALLKKSISMWLNSGKPLAQHFKGTIFASPMFPEVETLVRCGGKTSPFDSILSQPHLCQKLPKLADVCLSYSVQHQWLLLLHSQPLLSVAMFVPKCKLCLALHLAAWILWNIWTAQYEQVCDCNAAFVEWPLRSIPVAWYPCLLCCCEWLHLI